MTLLLDDGDVVILERGLTFTRRRWETLKFGPHIALVTAHISFRV